MINNGEACIHIIHISIVHLHTRKNEKDDLDLAASPIL